MHDSKESTLKRLRRIEGQVRGIGRMIEEDRYCIDVLQQLQAVQAAVGKVQDAVLKDHSATCVAAAIASGDEAAQREKFAELVDLMSKHRR
ncbi:MAG: metal-sensitive transcriptional regulator [Pseudomonadota bacterium]